MNQFLEHIEKYLGKIKHGWTQSFTGEPMLFQVIACQGGLLEGVTAFLTLGLSDMELVSPVSQKSIRHELLMLVRATDETVGVPSVLQQMGHEALSRGVAYLRGDVIGPRGNVFNGTALEAIYVTMPTYYPDEFSTFHAGDSSKVIAWMVPITSKEAEYARMRGWSAFETLLESTNPDLLDLKRRSMV